MTRKERILKIRLIDKAKKNPQYARKLGIFIEGKEDLSRRIKHE